MKALHFNVGPTPGNPVSTGRTTVEAMKALRKLWSFNPQTRVRVSKKIYRRGVDKRSNLREGVL
jgi:hypothetical protein